MSIMEVACFNFLKTKLKLGYAVYTQVHTDDDVTGISITVQSHVDKFSCEQIKEKIVEFLTEFRSQLRDLTDLELEG